MLAATAATATLGASSLQAQQQDFDTAELLSGTSTLGAPVLSPRDTNLVYSTGNSSVATPYVVYPINVSATVTAETGPTGSTRNGVTTLTSTWSTSRVTNNTILGLILPPDAISSSRLVFVTDSDGIAVNGVGIANNNGLFVCSSSNLATGNLTAVNPETSGVEINLAAGLPLQKSTGSYSNNGIISSKVDAKIPVSVSADYYSADGIGSFTSTLAKARKFSANLTADTQLLSASSASFQGLNTFSALASASQNVTVNIGTPTTVALAEAFDFSPFSQLQNVSYSLSGNLTGTGATINATTGNVTFNATTAGNYTAGVTATLTFTGRSTPSFVTTPPFTVTVNPPAPVVSVTGNLTNISITRGQSVNGIFTATNGPVTSWLLDGLASKNGLSISGGNLTASDSATNWTGQVTAVNAGGTSNPVTLSITVYQNLNL